MARLIYFVETGESIVKLTDGLAEVAIKERYPEAVGRLMPDNGFIYWRNQASLDAFAASNGNEGMAIAEVSRGLPGVQ